MKSIDHLPESEKRHYEKCPICDEYFDARDLNQVAEHLHDDLGKVQWESSRKVGEPTEYPNPDKGIDKIDLN